MKIFLILLLAAALATPTKFSSASPVQTRDNWRSVRTNNLLVIGNADPEKLRQVAAWLEFFHSAFARLVSRNVLDPSVPTTVVLFRDEASFTPFKPLYQGRPANVAGFFQPGEDVNYIAISLDPAERDPFSTAFHEYVHLHLKDNVPGAPLWLNEGLAEFYGSMQFSGGEAVLGAPLNHYIRLLRAQEMLPLSTLFSIGTQSPHYNEQEKSGIFYGQSWALVHYLMLGGGSSTGSRQEQFKRFLGQVSRGEPAAKALQDSFGMSLEVVEKELEAYVRRGEFSALRIASADPEAYASYTAMQRTSLTEAEANYYLGDLLFHINRESDAERYFKQAIALDPALRSAHAALGLIYVYQKRYADAKTHLQRATETQQSYLIHYLYAFVLSREGVSASGRISDYSRETATLMREHLQKSITLAPKYAPSYYLLALVDLVTDERLDEALEMAKKARQLAPSKASYSLLLAQIHLRRSEPAEARSVLESLARSSDTAVRSEAQSLLDSMSETNSRSATAAPRVSSAMIAETPENSSSARIIGGGSSGVVIRDGNTIEASGTLPAVDDLLARYIEALGGEAALKKVNRHVIMGTVDVAGVSRGGSFETHAEAPNKLATVIQAHPVGTISFVYNGKNGWHTNGRKVTWLKGVDLAVVQREADYFSPMRIKNNFAKVTLPGMSKIGYRDVYVLDLQPAVGPLERLYLDAQTHLPVRLNTVRTVGGVQQPVEVYFDDWREVEGVKYPFSISQSSTSLKLAFTVKEIRQNVAVDAKLFEPPR